MGCKNCKPKNTQEDFIIFHMVESIEREDCLKIRANMELFASIAQEEFSTVINKSIIDIRMIKLSPLSYSVWTGRAFAFSYLLESMGASFQMMEKNFEKEHLLALRIICERGYLELLKKYLPYYMDYKKIENFSQVDKEDRVVYTNSNVSYGFTYSSAHVACDMEYIGIINYLHEYFKDENAPTELDLHHIDESTGENCALIAVRTGNLALIKILFEKIDANFYIRNSKQQSALQIIIEASQLKKEKYFFPCVSYLVEVIKIDIEYMHEKNLRMCNDEQIFNYLRGILLAKGSLNMINSAEFTNSDLDIKPAHSFEIEDFIKTGAEISVIAQNLSGNTFRPTLPSL